MKLTRLFLFISILILSSNIFAQGEFVDEKINAIGLATGLSFADDANSLDFGFGYSSKNKYDIGLNIGKLFNGYGHYASPFFNYYFVKELKTNNKILSLAVQIQPTFIDSKRGSNRSSFAAGINISKRIYTSSTFVIQPNGTLGYHAAEGRNAYLYGIGLSFYSIGGIHNVGMSFNAYCLDPDWGISKNDYGGNFMFFIILPV